MMTAYVLGLAIAASVAATPDGSTDADRSTYEAAVAAAGRDADAQVKLALWCEAHGMPAERLKHLTRAVLLDPDNARARGLLGQVQRDGKWMRPRDVAKAIEQSPEQKALIDEYFARRVKAKDDADDQYKLALWCEEHGLTQPMVAHLRRTLQLDPSREGALRRMGFKKVGGRWVSPEVEALAKAERDIQAKADREWKPRLERLRLQVEGKGDARRGRALAELTAIADPRAVPMILQVFGRGDEARQKTAVDVLSRIDGHGASTALATMAVFSSFATIRSDAAAVVKRRDPREFTGLLATLLRDEIKYKIKPIDGPGSQGVLELETKDKRVRRLYRTPDAVAVRPGDRVSTDENGEVFITRPYGQAFVSPMMTPRGLAAALSSQMAFGALAASQAFATTADPITGLPMVPPGPGWAFDGFQPSFVVSQQRPDVAAATLTHAGIPASLAKTVAGDFRSGLQLSQLDYTYAAAANLSQSLASVGSTTRAIIQESLLIPVRQMEAEAQATARVARMQIEQDAAAIEAYNAPIREVNERAVAVLKSVSGEDRGADREKWMDWVVDLNGYGQPLRNDTSPTATVVEDVPIAYQPQTKPVETIAVTGFRIGPSCFAGGTPVRTIQGDRPIESIRPGDLVLSQDTTTGKLSYQPVVEVLHNPPNWTYNIDLGGESVHPTGIHRFWKAGHGWVMAREIKAGDKLRTVGGVVEVVSAEKEKVQPVFNLLLSGGDNYCVGGLGLVAHDNGFVEPVARPFDGVPTTAELASTKP